MGFWKWFTGKKVNQCNKTSIEFIQSRIDKMSRKEKEPFKLTPL